MIVNVSYEILPKVPSANASVVMDHFGVGFEVGRKVIADHLDVPVQSGDVVLFSGPSGSGKSSLMRAAGAQQDGVLDIELLDLGRSILVDALPTSTSESLSLLAACGLGEAQLLLRTPQELSDGQRYRFRLALALSQKPQWIMADEFTAALDRALAKVIAFNIRKLASRLGVGCLLATTHADIIEDLQPDLVVHCSLEREVQVIRQNVKKNESVLPPGCGSRRVPQPTGRTLLAGITAAIISGSFVVSRFYGMTTNPSASVFSLHRP